MRLISYRRPDGGDGLGVTSDASWMAASELLPDGPSSMAALLAAGPTAVEALAAAARPGRIAEEGRPLDDLDWLAPVPRPGKVDRRSDATTASTSPRSMPSRPRRRSSSANGRARSSDMAPRSAGTRRLTAQVDYEAELGVVIGRRARRVDEADALDHVLGYTCINDVTARDLQFGDGQWVRGKSLDTFCPMGPALVTTDEIPDPQRPRYRVPDRRSGHASTSNTSQMYFGVAAIVSYCSQAFTLEPGDVIASGTPGGVGVFRDPPVLLARRRRGLRRDRADRPADEHLPIRRTGRGGTHDGRQRSASSSPGALGCIGAWTVRDTGPRGRGRHWLRPGRRPATAAPDHVRRGARPGPARGRRHHGPRRPRDARSTTTGSRTSSTSPRCRCRSAGPTRRSGRAVNVVGTINVFEAVKRRAERMAPVVYTSSIAVFADERCRPGHGAAGGRCGRPPAATTTGSTSRPTRGMPGSTGWTTGWRASGCARRRSTASAATRG